MSSILRFPPFALKLIISILLISSIQSSSLPVNKSSEPPANDLLVDDPLEFPDTIDLPISGVISIET